MIHLLPYTDLAGKKSKYALALLKFDTLESLQHVLDVLTAQEIVNEEQAPFKFGISYDTRATGEAKWVGVVLRNLPVDAEVAGIMKHFKTPKNTGEQSQYKIVSVEPPQKIKGQVCTVISVPTIEDAERVSSYWNDFRLSEN